MTIKLSLAGGKTLLVLDSSTFAQQHPPADPTSRQGWFSGESKKKVCSVLKWNYALEE